MNLIGHCHFLCISLIRWLTSTYVCIYYTYMYTYAHAHLFLHARVREATELFHLVLFSQHNHKPPQTIAPPVHSHTRTYVIHKLYIHTYIHVRTLALMITACRSRGGNKIAWKILTRNLSLQGAYHLGIRVGGGCYSPLGAKCLVGVPRPLLVM